MNDIKKLLFFILALLLAILTIRFILWLLPLILIGALAYYIYNKLTKNKVTVEKKSKYKSNKIEKKKKIIIIDEDN